MVEVPQQDERLRMQSVLELEEESFISRLPLIRQPVVDTQKPGYNSIPNNSVSSDDNQWGDWGKDT